MRSQDFVNLRTHTNYSLSEGMLTPNYIADFCTKDQQPACAITDTSNLFGAFEFSEKLFSSGIKPIIGMQVNVYDKHFEGKHFELVLLAKSEEGYKNLVTIANKINKGINSNIYKKINIDFLIKHRFGLIILSGGYQNGYIGNPSFIGEKRICFDRAKYIKTFLGNDFYIELQRSNVKEVIKAENELLSLSLKLNIPIVATNDTFFKDKNHFEAFEMLSLIEKSKTISSKKQSAFSQENYFKSKSQMISLFEDLPEALQNTIIIAKKCSFCLKPKELSLPKFVNSESDDEFTVLKQISEIGLEKRLTENNIFQDLKKLQIYKSRLKDELDVISKMGFSGYFLIVSDFVKWSKNNNIPVGPGRGSGAGSIVAWCIQITELDPIKWGLLFERFLNPERVSMPDFDIDFCQERRDEVINYIKNRYGHENVAQIITFGSLQARAAIRDVGRVLEMPYNQVDQIAKLIPATPANPVTLSKALETQDELLKSKQENEEVSKLIDLSLAIEGLNRHVSTHAAGIVIAEKKLDNLIPLYSEKENEIPATQFNLKYIEKAGLVKFDILGLKTLTIISFAEKLIKKNNKNFNISKINIDDKKVYSMLSEGQTIGVFQLESKGMQNALRGLKPDRFEDIIAVVALYRPGPMENIPKYINRKHGIEKIEYMHESLSDILSETYGIFIYQEQVMQAAQVLAGYSLASADILRRAMGKKDKKEMDMQKEKFIDGAKNIDIKRFKAEEIFDQIAAFAGYGFNKSHAAAYALIAYQCAWLKANYPHEFFASLMTYDSDNVEKLSIFVHELNRMKIKIHPPCINFSFDKFIVEEFNNQKCIRYSLSSLKNVGNEAVKKMVSVRNKLGKFKSFDNFVDEVPQNIFGKRGLESLTISGCFDDLNISRNKLFNSISNVLTFSQRLENDKLNHQNNLFKNLNELSLTKSFKEVSEFSIFENEENELNSFGFHLKKHPIKKIESVYDIFEFKKSSFFNNDFDTTLTPKIYKFIGIVKSIFKRKSQSGNLYAVIEASDIDGIIEIFMDIKDVNFIEENFNKNQIFAFNLEIRFDRNSGIRIICLSIHKLFDLISKNIKYLNLWIVDRNCLKNLKDEIQYAKIGDSEINIVLKTNTNLVRIILNENIKINDFFINNISKIPFLEKIVIK
ncbi:DNA polymerase III subunit alpha [Alphaproteobacteria bacterium]|nr:DNA polymerase III subunit alpha [Alphaproteobacteria bacterium]